MSRGPGKTSRDNAPYVSLLGSTSDKNHWRNVTRRGTRVVTATEVGERFGLGVCLSLRRRNGRSTGVCVRWRKGDNVSTRAPEVSVGHRTRGRVYTGSSGKR